MADLPGVGENLQDHLQLRMIYKVSGIKTLNTKANSWFGKMMISLEYLLKRSDPMSMAPSQLGALAYSSPEQPRANVEYHFSPYLLSALAKIYILLMRLRQVSVICDLLHEVRAHHVN